MSRPSIAEDIFRGIVLSASPVKKLRDMVASDPPTTEDEHFDCKGGSERGMPLPDAKIKSVWSEAVAGFATTGGGVLVFGLDARKVGDSKVDQVVGMNLIADPMAVKSRLAQLTSQATDPPVPGILIEAYDDPAEPGKGFVVCYVPESVYKPHRQEMGSKRWVMRISDSFVDVSPPILRSLFFPARQSYIFAEIAFSVDRHNAGKAQGVYSVQCEVRLYNEGPASATTLMILIHDNGLKVAPGAGWQQLKTPAGQRLKYLEDFHPGSMVVMADMVGDVALGSHQGNPGVKCAFQLYARDQSPQQINIHAHAAVVARSESVKGLPAPLPVDRYR
jgi:hypothetical protein